VAADNPGDHSTALGGNMNSRCMLAILVAIVALLTMSCSSLDTGSGDDSGSGFAGDVDLAVGSYLVLELDKKTVTAVDATTAMAAIGRVDRVVFRRLPVVSAVLGETSVFAESNEGQRTVSIGPIYIGLCEITRGQWERLAGDRPWESLPTNLVGALDADERLPAVGITYDSVTNATASMSAGRSFTLRLPTNHEWEAICRGGTASRFSWGDAATQAQAQTRAWVWETVGGMSGPHVVAGKEPNPFGLYDCHGNVWEWTVGREIRGGSWRDSIHLARSANRVFLDHPNVRHPLVGVRLVLER